MMLAFGNTISACYGKDRRRTMGARERPSPRPRLSRPVFHIFLFFMLLFPAILSAADEKTTVRVGVFQNKPLSFIDDQGRVGGLYPEILEEIAKHEGWDLEFATDSWAGLLKRLEEGAIDLMISIAHSEERDEIFDFSKEPVVTVWGQVYTRGRKKLSNILDLDGKTAVVMRGDINGLHFRELLGKFNIACHIVEATGYEEVCRTILDGGADAGVINHFSGSFLKSQYAIHPTPIIFNPVNGYFAATAGKNAHLLTAIDRRLSRWRTQNDSIYYEILHKWLGAPEKKGRLYKLAAIIIGMAMGLFCLFYFWIKRLRQRVRRKGEALAESEEKFRSIVESSPLGMHFYKMNESGDLIFTGANPSADAILGVDNRQFIGKTIEQAFPALVGTETPRQYRQVCLHGEPWHTEQITYDEGKIKGAFEASAFRTAPGVIAVMFQEISERIQTRRALKRSEKRFRSLVENALVGICIVKEGRIVYMNPELENVLGDHPDTVTLDQLALHPDDSDTFFKYYESIRRSDASRSSLSFRWLQKDPESGKMRTKWLHCKANRIEYHDYDALLFTIVDVTRARELEKIVRTREKMASLGNVAAGIAHEIRNPLSGINVMLDGVRETFEEPAYADDVKGLLDGAQKASDKIARVIERVLDFSRPGDPCLAKMDINTPIRENLIERGALISRGPVLSTRDLGVEDAPRPPPVIDPDSSSDARFPSLPQDGIDLEALEAHYIREATGRSDGNDRQAASLLGMSYYAFRYRKKKMKAKR